MNNTTSLEEVIPLTSAQLDAYLARIGLSRPASADFETLAAIHSAHLYSFTWEALDAFMGWPSSVDPQDAFAKMVEGQRGGWCYEMNGLLGAALAALGFQVTRLCAAVNREFLGDAVIGNHLTLRVDLDQPYLAEVGIGDAIVAPVPLRIGPVLQRGFDFSITESGDGWLRFQNHALGFARSYDFQVERRDETAIVALHRWLSNNAASPFAGTLVLSRHTSEGYVSLKNDQLSRVSSHGAEEVQITSADEFADTLTAVFKITVPQPRLIWEKIMLKIEGSRAA